MPSNIRQSRFVMIVSYLSESSKSPKIYIFDNNFTVNTFTVVCDSCIDNSKLKEKLICPSIIFFCGTKRYRII
jgi:hypothetical protein